jgi:hypothetical protein
MTQELANSIVSSSVRCTQATLRAFGIEGIPKLGSGCLEYLTRAGFKLQRISYSGMKLRDISKCCGISTHKNYLINTKGHAMALINGILIDTEGKGFDRRIIEFIWEVTK